MSANNTTNTTAGLSVLISSTPLDVNAGEDISPDDAAWILANAFLIITMQTGFGMLEAGSVASKNVANIMVKNVIDVSLGGILYWAFGYGLSFGTPSNAFCGYGNFFLTDSNVSTMGTTYATYIFQFSFASAATTIVSGAVAERMKLSSYMIFSSLNIFVYCIPASWAWASSGFLKKLGFYDFAGACVVHMNGGASALVAAVMIGPRLGRFNPDDQPEAVRRDFGLSSPVTALTGTFMLWWAWLAFNCGSTFGINGTLWKTASKSAVNTMNGSIGGSLVGLLLSYYMSARKNKYFDIAMLISSILGGLVGITSCCAVITPFESLVIGAIGGFIAVITMPMMTWLKIDDPVGAIPVHFFAAIWSTLAVGLFADNEFDQLGGYKGLMRGGGFYLLGVQALGIVAISGWAALITFICFMTLKYTIGVRMDVKEEIFGADYSEHNIRCGTFTDKLERAFGELKLQEDELDEIVAKMMTELMKSNARTVDAKIRNISGAPPSRIVAIAGGSDGGSVEKFSNEEVKEIRSVVIDSSSNDDGPLRKVSFRNLGNNDVGLKKNSEISKQRVNDQEEDDDDGGVNFENMDSRKRRMSRNVFKSKLRRHKTQPIQPLEVDARWANNNRPVRATRIL